MRRTGTMLLDTNRIVSMTEANQNFSKVVKQAEEDECVVIFKNNRPKFVLMDIDKCLGEKLQTEDSLEDASRDLLNKAKWL